MFAEVIPLWCLLIHLSTAIELTPAGSSAVHIYTEKHNKTEYTERNLI